MATVMDLTTRQDEPTPENYAVGFTSLQGFELSLRAAKLLSNSELVPLTYRAWKEEKDANGNFVKWVPNNSGIPSCAIALNMANRMKADVLMIMQNLYVVHGRPGWSSKFLIATFNQCGRFSAVKYEWAAEDKKSAAFGCRAWATEKDTGERIEGPWITWELVRAEQWDAKRGSKWKTMPDLMFMYRAAAWMINTHAPEVSMGLSTAEENEDRIIDVQPEAAHPRSLTELVAVPQEQPEPVRRVRRPQSVPRPQSTQAEAINPDTGEITGTPTHTGEPSGLSVATLISRLHKCDDQQAAIEIMTHPDVDLLNAEDAAALNKAYRAHFGETA